jgi:peroxiredoxin
LAEHTPICNFGWKAPSFSLPGVDGKTYSLDGLKGENGTLLMFICNHCPYVKAVIDRIVRDVEELRGLGVGAVAISSNDAAHYPEDSFDNMMRFAADHGFTFPYLYDESQEVLSLTMPPARPISTFQPSSSCTSRRLDASRKRLAPRAPRAVRGDERDRRDGEGTGGSRRSSMGCSTGKAA